MAITETLSAQMASTYRRYPIDDHGKTRWLYGKVTQGVAVGDIGSSMVIGDLPPGRVRILPWLCRYKNSAFGAGVTMSLGHDLYYDLSSPPTDTGEPAAPGAFGAALSVAAAGEVAFPVTGGLKFDIYSRAGARVRATFAGAVVPAGAVLEVLIAYITD